MFEREEAARTVIGVQAQDLRAAALALRSRVLGLTRGALRAAARVRTRTVRGTVYLIAASDVSWLAAGIRPRLGDRSVGAGEAEAVGLVPDVATAGELLDAAERCEPGWLVCGRAVIACG